MSEVRLARRKMVADAGGPDLDELLSPALDGLVDALRRYDPSREVAFTTYAHHRVRGSIRDWCRKQDPFGRQGRAFARRRDQISDLLTDETEGPPDPATLSRVMRLAPEVFASRSRRARRPDELSVLERTPGSRPRSSQPAAEPPLDRRLPDDLAAAADLWRTMRTCLSSRQQQVMDMVIAGHKLGSIATTLNMSDSMACIHRGKARKRLAAWMVEHDIPVPGGGSGGQLSAVSS